jgi:hypothetical protein
MAEGHARRFRAAPSCKLATPGRKAQPVALPLGRGGQAPGLPSWRLPLNDRVKQVFVRGL